MRALRTLVLAGICAIAIVLSSGCDREKWSNGQGIRASIVMFPTADTAVDPRLGLGYYYYEMTNKQKAEFDFDFVPDLSSIGDNNYMTLRADYLTIIGDTSMYYGGGGGIMCETLPNSSDMYFMVEAVFGYIWSIGSGDKPFPFDIRLTVQYVTGADNAPLVMMGTFNYEFSF